MSCGCETHLGLILRSRSFYWNVIIFFIRLPPEFLPASGPDDWWCASTLGAALLCSSRVGSWFGAYIQIGLRALSIGFVLPRAKGLWIRSALRQPRFNLNAQNGKWKWIRSDRFNPDLRWWLEYVGMKDMGAGQLIWSKRPSCQLYLKYVWMVLTVCSVSVSVFYRIKAIQWCQY